MRRLTHVLHKIRFGQSQRSGVGSLQPGEFAKIVINRLLEGHAIKRVIETSEQAAAILWLSSPDAAMVTGQNLAVDGGWTAR